jgi:hypothetical protein
VLYAAACLICAAVTASAHLHLAAQDRPCSSQHHLDNRHRKTKASINQDLSTLTKLDFQTTKHFGHALAKSASLSPFTSTELGEGKVLDPEATTQTPTHKQPTRIEDTMLPLYDSVFAEKLSHQDLPPSFVWNHKEVSVASDRKVEFEETTSRGRAAARQRLEYVVNHESQATQAQPTVIDLTTLLEPEPIKHEHIKQEHNNSEEDGTQTVVEQRFIIVTPRTQASWVSEAHTACKANKKVRWPSSCICTIRDRL